MPRIAWLSDIHLNFLKPSEINQFIDLIRLGSPDSIWISGDIGQSKTVIEYLKLMGSSIECPIFFVLGNHDYYEGSVSELREKIQYFCLSSNKLHWLNDAGVVEVSPEVGLIGHDSWADGRFGDYNQSELIMNDHLLISEFNPVLGNSDGSIRSYPSGIRNIYLFFLSQEVKQERLSVMQALAGEAHQHVETQLPRALAKYKHVYFMTHVPPFKEACWHRGKISDDFGLPHFSCQIVGDSIVRIMKDFPDRHLTVLCGHTHSQAEARILDNLTVFSAEAVYGSPSIQKFIEIE